MAARKFKFVSPGVFLKEVDNSQLPKLPGPVGPAIIGRTRRGPALKPFKVNSYSEFVEVFGEPIPGNQGEDVWREGNGLLAASYAPYAAKAYFAADIESPVTVVRLLGVQGDDAVEASSAVQDGMPYGRSSEAGWHMPKAFGLFITTSGSINKASGNSKDAHLCAVLYGEDNFNVGLYGNDMSGSLLYATGAYATVSGAASARGSAGHLIRANSDKSFTLVLGAGGGSSWAGGGTPARQRLVDVSFQKGSKYIRDVLNTNPVATNSRISYTKSGSLSDVYWLGETYDEFYNKIISDADANAAAFILPLSTAGDFVMGDYSHEMASARSGWVFAQDESSAASYDPTQMSKLFRFHALHEGETSSKEIVTAIEDIRIPVSGSTDSYATFTVSVKRMFGQRIETVESYPGCTLNPNSQNYIAAQIGDQYLSWSALEKRNKIYGNHPNRSFYIRVEMDPSVDVGNESPSKAPFGFLGPIVPKDHSLTYASSSEGSKLWMTGAVHSAFNGNLGTLTFKWPSAETVVSASVRGDDHFGAAFHRVSSKGVLSSEANSGLIDYHRVMPTGYRSDQVSGLASANTKYSYSFSLDEVYVSGLSIGTPSSANVSKVYHISGSRRGVTAAAATATITTVAEAALVDTKDFVLIDAAGVTTTYNFTGGKANATNSAAYTPGTTVDIGYSDLSSRTSVRDAIITRINAGTSIGFTAAASGDNVLVTQNTAGIAGNTNITEPAGDTGLTFPAAFTGGSDSTPQSYTATYDAQKLTELGFDKFWMPLVGGHDGVDIREADPFNNTVIDGKTSSDSYAYASLERAIETLKDPEAVECNVMVAPGLTNASLTTKLVQTCEARADALAVIDLPNVYIPPHETKCDTFEARLGTTPLAAAKKIANRALNSSYGCTYYPWLKIKDTENTRDVWVPPSVIALGIFAYTEEAEEVWFAPAGFNRGGLNEGNAGLPVLQVTEQLLSKQRDQLYEANVNPIASFVTEGIVVFGQKTLQSTPSALDRINVRRLLILIKKEVSRIASGLLFDQNVPQTWNRFLGQVVPFLESVKTRLGLSDFKVILDESTTTPDLIDRNIMYAKIFLKPARAIEFIAVDFVITRTGAAFDD